MNLKCNRCFSQYKGSATYKLLQDQMAQIRVQEQTAKRVLSKHRRMQKLPIHRRLPRPMQIIKHLIEDLILAIRRTTATFRMAMPIINHRVNHPIHRPTTMHSHLNLRILRNHPHLEFKYLNLSMIHPVFDWTLMIIVIKCSNMLRISLDITDSHSPRVLF